MGDRAVFLSAGGYHHHIALNTWESAGGPPPAPGTTGLYHVALLYPDRASLARAVRSVTAAGYRLDALTVQEAEGGKYDVEMTFYHRRTGKGDLTDDRDLTAAVKSLRGMDRDVRDKLGRVKLALRYAYAGHYVDVTELDMNPFDGSLPEATQWTERVEN